MNLLDYMSEQKTETESPLASRLRPTTLDEVVGQKHIIGKDKLLYRAIQADKLSSLIFYGPPGTGKTTLAKVIANTTSAEFMQINATSAGKKDMEEVVAAAKNNQGRYGKKTILFIDEIHRFNKGQQDYLLPFVEDGTIILIGATTENPYFEVNPALLSRSVIFELKKLSTEDIRLGVSQPRNQKLAEIFHRLRLIESYGTGIRRIFKLYASCPVQPSIEATTNAFRIVLPNMNVASAGAEIAAEAKPAAPIITPQMKIVLDYLKEYGEMRDEELQELLHIKKTRAYLLTRQMNEEGLIKVVGRGAEKKYRLK